MFRLQKDEHLPTEDILASLCQINDVHVSDLQDNDRNKHSIILDPVRQTARQLSRIICIASWQGCLSHDVF